MEQVQKQLNDLIRSMGKAAEEEEIKEPGGKGADIKTEMFSLSVDLRRVEVGNSF